MSSRQAIPVFEVPIIETHCHLDYLQNSPAETIAAANEVGIERIITISVSAKNLATVRAICRDNAGVWGTQGIHPHEAAEFNNLSADTIRTHLLDPKLIAVGEIGLDYFYDHCERKQQLLAFEKQLEIASELNLPVVIHTREADEDTRSILKNASAKLARKGVIHSFTSGRALAEFCLDEGFYLGFNGISTFKKAQNVRDIISITPLERIVLETDAPYLTPVPYRGKENSPKYLPFIAQQVALTKNVDINTCLKTCYENSLNLFFHAEHVTAQQSDTA